MTILKKHFLKEFFKYFAILILSFTAIAVIAEFFDKAPEFYPADPPVILVVQYLLLQAPRVLMYALPFASLFSILITIGIASKAREITTIKASGCSTRKFFSYYLVIGVIMSLAALLLGETLVPAATKMATEIRKIKILKQSHIITLREQSLWLRGIDSSLIRIDGFVEGDNRILRTSIFSFDSSFNLEKRIEAQEGIWKEGIWQLKNATVFDFKTGIATHHADLTSTALESPEIFQKEMKRPEEMNFLELHSYYQRLEKTGFKNIKYIVRLYEKLAYPVINFVMVVFGLALSLSSKWGGGIKAAGLGIIVSVLYWLLYSISVSLGFTGFIPPALAPFISPIIFGTAGSILYYKIQE